MRASPLIAALVLTSATPALAAQNLTITYAPPDAGGLIYPTAAFDWPAEGQRAKVTLAYEGLELQYANFFADVTLFKTWWTEPFGLDGNEYTLAFDCGDWNGCLAPAGPNVLTGWLETPRGFSIPCSAATLGDCSERYEINFAVFDGIFRVVDQADYGLQITIGDPVPVPEPTTWAIMLLGFAAVGVMARRRRARLA